MLVPAKLAIFVEGGETFVARGFVVPDLVPEAIEKKGDVVEGRCRG